MCRVYLHLFSTKLQSNYLLSFLRYGQCKEDEDSGAKVGNRFMDLQSCEKRCVKPPGSGRCYLPKVKGPCEAKVPSWYFDKNWNQCMPFDYGGCLGNANRFETSLNVFRRIFNKILCTKVEL